MQFFGVPIDTLTFVLVLITGGIVALVVLLALSNAIFFKIGVRNIARRRAQMVLIVFALMLSTTLLSSVLAVGDVMTAAVQSVAVYNWGNVDELIEGGSGDLGTYSQRIYNRVHGRAQNQPDIASVAAALREQNVLVADQTSRQVRSKVTALAVLPGSEQGFGGMQDINSKRHVTITALGAQEIYLNQTLAQFLNAHPGDTLYLYSSRWEGKRYSMRVAAIVSDDGLVGDNPYILAQLHTFQDIEGKPNQINQIFVANRGGGGVSGVNLSDSVSSMLGHWLPRNVHVIQVKQQGVQNSQNAQEIFSRIFALFSLFALAIGLLLIFLIFVLLAAERRAEMGMARAIGVQRRHLILMFLFEGAVYDLLSSFVGLLFGIGVGALLVYLLTPILLRFNFPLKLTFQPHSLILAYCLGVVFTFLSLVLSSWLVSRMTVVEAMRDLPEPGYSALSLGELSVSLLHIARQLLQPQRENRLSNSPEIGSTADSLREKRLRNRQNISKVLRRVRRVLLEQLPDIFVGLLRELTFLGFLPLLAGFWLMQNGLGNAQVIPFSLGLSLIVLGGALLLKAGLTQVVALVNWVRRKEDYGDRGQRALMGPFAAVVGLLICAYWALPFDVLALLGLPRFQGGIEVFFVAGVMMVLGTAWALIANAGLFIRPLLALCSRLTSFYVLVKLATAYPLHRRFRTGLAVVMFALVVFAMTVMATITNAMQNTYVDINVQTGGYDIQGSAYFKALPAGLTDMRSSLAAHGINPDAFSAIGMRSATAVGIVQLSADTPRWSLYPAQVVSGGFLQGYGLHLTARAKGFASDNAVWQALQSHPDYALIDSSALPYNPNVIDSSSVYDPNSPSANQAGAPATPPNFDPRFTFSLSGIYQGDVSFSPAPIWVTGMQGKEAVKLTIIGVVDNSDNAHFGLYIPQAAYSQNSLGAADPAMPEAQTYYFKVAPGQDVRGLALALGSAYLDNGLETTVLEDAIWQVRGPRIFLSNVLLGVVAMTLLLGVSALAITGTRAVIERRQQIGMLRALGCRRRMIQSAFLLESFLVGAAGSILGCGLGLILARNIFAANFFEQYQTGLTFSIPWDQLVAIIGVALLASFLGALLPAWQAGKISPAEALRYS